MTPETLPKSVRYVKVGKGGQWWPEAKKNAQIHAGWEKVQKELLEAHDLAGVKALDPGIFGQSPGVVTRDRNALLALLDRPSQHLWITFQHDYLWWCTVRDGIEVNPDGQSKDRGYFWLSCATPWNNRSLGGTLLSKTDLPGIVSATAGFQATVCEPKGWREILRAIRDEKDCAVVAALAAREAYTTAVEGVIGKLGDKDFEVLIDLVLSRDGWARLEKRGGSREGIDVEVEHLTTNEIAFVQVKSRANQKTLDKCVADFKAGRERYARMIFAVHTEEPELTHPVEAGADVWNRSRIAKLVVRLGLSDWLMNRVG